ncbi:unnamed protein product [Gongylonema pulchrum]|uniref:Uncharacterized protein n=1 Tax=Gongylonema pulchrum TaxID=637853 RepID=A0A183DEF6_9BILA|nr:unnamed protein product [Gongylonema pulchrum]
MLDMKRLEHSRLIRFNVSAEQNSADLAVVVLLLSSDPDEVMRQRRKQSQPKFIHPWRRDMNIIPANFFYIFPLRYEN